MQTFVILGSLMMFLAVALGAFGPHALKARLSPEKLKVYETGVQYHIAHALGLLLLGLLADRFPDVSLIITAGWFLLVGIILFSGSLYMLSITGRRIFGPITPLGGVAFLIGWILVLIAVV